MKNKIIYTGLIAGLLVVGSGCAKLDVKNENNPDTQRVLATSDDLKGVVAGAFQSTYSIFGDAQNAYYANVNLEWTADYITMTNNVRAWWSQFKIEPRVAFNNTLAFADLSLSSRPYKQLHAAISNANDVIRAIEIEGKKVGNNGSENNMVLAGAYFAKAMALGYLANTWDKAYVVGPTDDFTKAELKDYKQVLIGALAAFDKVIQLSASSFTLPSNFINTPSAYTNVQLGRLANTYAANFMVQNARNRVENGQTDWAKVRAYTQNGMTQDYVIRLDGANWRNGMQEIAGLNWYWRTDHRIIRLLDPNYPKRFPTAPAATLPEATSTDPRLGLYFQYEPSLSFFNLARGAQLRSHYRFKRYDALYAANGIGNATFLYAYTNDLLRAEAAAMTNDLPTAINILNNGRRVTVGNRAPIGAGATRDQVLEAIFSERDLELMLTDYAIHFKDMRRRDMLQRGTILHYPVPADVLAVLQQTFYTYGGVENADGKNTADGSNSWLN
jgi:hypothetical protein